MRLHHPRDRDPDGDLMPADATIVERPSGGLQRELRLSTDVVLLASHRDYAWPPLRPEATLLAFCGNVVAIA